MNMPKVGDKVELLGMALGTGTITKIRYDENEPIYNISFSKGVYYARKCEFRILDQNKGNV
jgi:hypothetical protein